MLKWTSEALCVKQNVPTWKFFEGYESDTKIQLEIDALCSACPVQADCKMWGEEKKVEGGVFGRHYFPVKTKGRKRVKL